MGVQRFIVFLLIITFSCSQNKQIVKSEKEIEIAKELSKVVSLKKYKSVYVHRSQKAEGFTLDIVNSYKNSNKRIRFFTLKGKDSEYLNLYKIDGQIIDSLNYFELEKSLLKLKSLNNDSIDKMVIRILEGVHIVGKDTRKYYYKP